MYTKLTLRMDKKIIDKAKRISHKKGKSISQIVSEYLLKEEISEINEDYEETPLVKKLKGIIKDKDLNEGDYHKYLEEKYK
ncbi:MAG: DUF6364 family protein [Ignavibacteriaceae bacterium]